MKTICEVNVPLLPNEIRGEQLLRMAALVEMYARALRRDAVRGTEHCGTEYQMRGLFGSSLVVTTPRPL